MKFLGLVQANDWVPRDQRELYRAVAAALREGTPVHIGKVPSDQPVAAAPSDSRLSSHQEKMKAWEVSRQAERKAAKDLRQKELQEDFERADEQARVTYKGKPKPARVVGRWTLQRSSPNRGGYIYDFETKVIAKQSEKQYVRLTFTMSRIPGEKHTYTVNRQGWALDAAAEQHTRITAVQKHIESLHPGTEDIQDAEKELDALRRGKPGSAEWERLH